jgi:hypothetical protein
MLTYRCFQDNGQRYLPRSAFLRGCANQQNCGCLRHPRSGSYQSPFAFLSPPAREHLHACRCQQTSFTCTGSRKLRGAYISSPTATITFSSKPLVNSESYLLESSASWHLLPGGFHLDRSPQAVAWVSAFDAAKAVCGHPSLLALWHVARAGFGGPACQTRLSTASLPQLSQDRH